jgi:hypothetical protein
MGARHPAEVLAGLAGCRAVVLGGTDGDRRGRSCSRRVPVGGWGAVVSVLPGRGAGPVGFRAIAAGGQAGGSSPASPVAVPCPPVGSSTRPLTSGHCRRADRRIRRQAIAVPHPPVPIHVPRWIVRVWIPAR